MTKLVICEKPGIAQSIAAVLGAKERKDGGICGNGWTVTWCIGHLVEPAQADAYDERYAKWRRADLPILPNRWQYIAAQGRRKQLDILRRLMNDKTVIGTVMGSTPIGWVFMSSVLAISFGILYMLLYSKVPKKGVVLPGGVLVILSLLMTNWIIPSIMLVIYIINELIWEAGSQKKSSKMVVAFTILMTGWAVASFTPILVMKDTHIAQFGDRAAYFEEAYSALAGPIGIGVLVAVSVASVLGTFPGRAILNFEKAGIV